MEEEVYGIDKDRAHVRATQLVPEDFFWSCINELAPFGSDEGDLALAEFRDWKKENPDEPMLNCLIWTVESVGEMKFEDYNETILSEEKIKAQIEDEEFDDHQYISTLDISIIATGFGQLVDEGKIDKENKPLIRIAIQRQIIYTELATDWKYKEEYISNLKVLERVLEEA